MSGKRRVRDWQKTDPHLRSHPYFVKFKSRLGVSSNEAHGILSGLWAFAFNFAHDGDLSRFDAEDIALGVEWEGDPDALMAALAVGFVNNGIIHDWYEWGGKLFGEHIEDAQRKYDSYHSEQGKISTEKTGENRRMPQRREEKKKPPSYSPLRGEQFEVFWAIYPKRKGNNRRKTVAAWNARLRDGETPERMIAASRHYAEERSGKDETYTLMAATFLGRDLRYEEWVDPPRAVITGNGKPPEVPKDGYRWACYTNPYTNVDSWKEVPA